MRRIKYTNENVNFITSDKATTPPVYIQELNWAIQLETKTKNGYLPNAQETSQYQDIAIKWSGQKSILNWNPRLTISDKTATLLSPK